MVFHMQQNHSHIHPGLYNQENEASEGINSKVWNTLFDIVDAKQIKMDSKIDHLMLFSSMNKSV